MSLKEQYWKYSLIAIILSLGIVIVAHLRPFMSGLLGACTIYVLLRRQMLYLTQRKKFRRTWAATLLIGETVLCFLIPLSLIVWMFVHKIQYLNVDPQQWIVPIQDFARLIEEKTGYNLLGTDNIASLAGRIPRLGQALMGEISGFGLNVFTLLFVLFFMLTGGSKMESYVYSILPFNPRNKRNVMNEIHLLVRSNAIGIPLLALIQGIIASVSYYIFQTPSPLLFGVLTCFASIIPVIGTAIVWIPLVAYSALTGDWGNAIGLGIYSIVITTNVDNLIRFLLQKKMADTHPLVTLFGVVIGLPLFGFMGVIFGPLLLSLFLWCVDIFKSQYLDDKPRWF